VPPIQGQTNFKDWLCNKTTGFYTHEYLRIILQHELNRYIVHRRPFAVLLMHVRKEPGPKIEACTIADRMQDITQLLRPSDFFCHYEGSSFAIVLPETDRSEARGLVKQILHLLGDPDAGHGGTGHIWLKVGAAAVPDDGESIETMLKMAQHPDHSKVLRLQ
jgi:GGDEF domain-containing protein